MNLISELMNLSGKRALITGATGLIGQQIAATIVELGGDVVLVDRPGVDYDPLVKMLRSIRQVEIDCVDCDLENVDSRAKLIKKINNNYPLDILINNAAFTGDVDLNGWTSTFEEQSVETWNRALEVNLTAIFDLSKGLKLKFEKERHGSIINIASIYGVLGPDYSLYSGTEMGNPAAYAASKGGLIQLTRWLATTLAPDVRVNTISPGGVYRNQPDKFVQRYVSRTPLARMANAEDFKGAIAYLASDLSGYVTGQNLLVDDGWSSW